MGLFSGIGHFLSSAAKAVGGFVAGAAKVVAKAIVTPITSTVDFVSAVVHGQRIDKAMLSALKQQVGAVTAVAPYAQMVISFVPGIGTVASAIIGGGLALAEGKPIDDVVAATIAGALPGGAFAKAAYDMGKDVIEHKPVLTVVTAGLGTAAAGLGFAAKGAAGLIDPDSQQALVQGLQEAHDVASGIKQSFSTTMTIEDAVAKMNLSHTQKKQFLDALKVGAAVGHARNTQANHCGIVTAQAPQVTAHGQAVTKIDPVVSAARAALGDKGLRGFDLGVGAMNSKGVVQYTLHCFRNWLRNPDDQAGFDAALALKIGRVAAGSKIAPLPPAQQAGHAIASGLATAPSEVRNAVKPVLQTPALAPGVRLAAHDERWVDLAFASGGGVIGALAGGPIGATIGAGVGYTITLLFSRGKAKEFL